MLVYFLIPNRDDPEKPPLEEQMWGLEVIPREGETVYIGETPWRVKWVRHTLDVDSDPRVKIEVRLIEPNHWSLDSGPDALREGDDG